MNRRNRPVELTDAPEHRSIPIEQLEIRADEGESEEYILTGYASTFEEYEMYGGPERYGWIERIDEKAFDKTLREKPDLHLLINHAGMPLARTKSGTLKLSTDTHGLKVEARLDKRDPEVQSLAVKMQRGDMDEMSFAFRVKAQEWRAADGFEDDDQSYRTITEVSLHKGDVSVVNWGANDTTSCEIKSAEELLRALVELDEDELAEVRSNEDLVKQATEKLGARAQVIVNNLNVAERELDEAREKAAEAAEEAGKEAGNQFSSQLAELGAAGLLEVLGSDLIESLRTLLLGSEESRAHGEDCDCEDCKDEEEMSEDEDDKEEMSEPRGMSLAEALAMQGVTPETRLSLAAAKALSQQ